MYEDIKLGLAQRSKWIDRVLHNPNPGGVGVGGVPNIKIENFCIVILNTKAFIISNLTFLCLFVPDKLSMDDFLSKQVEFITWLEEEVL